MRLSVLALACGSLLFSACVPDLSGWSIGGDPSLRDASVTPRADGGTFTPRSGGPCARPTLFAAVQELSGGPSRVMRWEIQGTGGLVACGDVLVDGRMSEVPFAVAAVSDTYIVVASRSGVLGIDPIEDRVLFSTPKSSSHPNDAFVVDDLIRGGRLPIVAWSGLGLSAAPRGTIRELDAYGPTGEVLDSWTGSELILGTATAITASPNAPSEALAMNGSGYIAGEVDLFDARRRRDPSLLGMLSNGTTQTIASGYSVSGVRRLVWSVILRDPTTGSPRPGIAISSDPWSTAELTFEAAGSCEGVACDPIHAVLDPTLESAALVICDGSPRRLLRFDPQRDLCEIWADGATLGTRRLSYLTVLP